MSAPPDFNRLARAYRWMEAVTFGPFLMRARCAFLAETTRSRRALILGDGDGRFTARLLAANPTVLIDAVDASPAMLQQLLRNAAPHAARVHTHIADARTFQPPGNYDLIASHFFLDCLTTAEVAALSARLRAGAAPGALWLVSDFAIPLGPVRLVAAPLVAALYRAFGLLTGLRIRSLPDHRSALATAGFRLAVKRNLLAGILVSELWTPAP
jgi:SAM-dependent methyltransferase